MSYKYNVISIQFVSIFKIERKTEQTEQLLIQKVNKPYIITL